MLCAPVLWSQTNNLQIAVVSECHRCLNLKMIVRNMFIISFFSFSAIFRMLSALLLFVYIVALHVRCLTNNEPSYA